MNKEVVHDLTKKKVVHDEFFFLKININLLT